MSIIGYEYPFEIRPAISAVKGKRELLAAAAFSRHL